MIATAQGSPLADTSIVTITAPLPTLQAIELAPASAALTAGDTVRFTARGRLTDGTYTPVAATFSATGGSISGTGLYTAGNVAGSYLAIAQAAPLADTAVISITAVQPPPPPPPGNYTPLLREGWRQASQAELQAAGYFSWSDSRSVYTFVSLVSDATFGQVVRLMQPAGTTASPRFQKSLPQSLSKAWFKYHVRFSPSWQIGGAGSGPAAYRLGEMRWSNHGQQAVLTIMGSSYRTEFAVTSGSTYLRYSETSIGSPGSLTTEFTGNDWWEYVSYYEQTAVTAARVHYWRRRLSASGTPSNWVYSALVVTGATTPTVGRIIFGWQKTRTTPVTQFVDLGPIEVVDGAVYPNPWGMPNL